MTSRLFWKSNSCTHNNTIIFFVKKQLLVEYIPLQMVNFVLEHLESNVTLGLLGNVYSETIPSIESDAIAVQYITLEQIKAIFKYQTDSFDTVNEPSSDIKYYTHYDAFDALDLNPANAMLDAAESSDPIAYQDAQSAAFAKNKMLLAHDFIRHMALDLFGTHLGVDILNNEKELVQNLRLVCGDSEEGCTWFDIKAAIKAVSTISTETLTGLEGDADKYMTNANITTANLCRVLFSQMMGQAASRFAEIANSEEEQSLPFEVADSIRFRLTVNPAEGQKLLTRQEADPEVASRVYEIRWVIVANDDDVKVNTAPDADEL
jgi:hypothetical protein